MITSQLITYIRGQVTAGIPLETIRQSLLLSEWTDRDIDEAFAQVPQAATKTFAPAVVAQPSFTGRKFALSAILVIASATYAAWQTIGGPFGAPHPVAEATPAQSYKAANDALLQTLAQIQNAVPSSTPVSTPAPAQTTRQSTMPGKMMRKMGAYTDGSYTGTPTDAYYGTVQVKAVITNGQLADVQFMQYPSDRSTSRYINSQAMPLLTQEAIQAQNANVSGVSGATFTSQAFQQSLASALVLAKN